MRHEFPILDAKISMIIVTPLIWIITTLYILRAASQSASEVYGLGMTAFGATAMLSGICFRIPDTVEGSSQFHFAGEKFLHSSILLIQTLIIIYMKDFIIKDTSINIFTWITPVVYIVTIPLIITISFMAANTWFQGFRDVNAQLWQNWQRRSAINLTIDEAKVKPNEDVCKHTTEGNNKTSIENKNI